MGDPGNGIDLEQVYELPIYRTDALVRRATALQSTADNPAPAAGINARQAERLGMKTGDRVAVHQDDGKIELPVRVDERVPDGCVHITAGNASSAGIGIAGMVRLVRN